jgi:hypothetical protein
MGKGFVSYEARVSPHAHPSLAGISADFLDELIATPLRLRPAPAEPGDQWPCTVRLHRKDKIDTPMWTMAKPHCRKYASSAYQTFGPPAWLPPPSTYSDAFHAAWRSRAHLHGALASTAPGAVGQCIVTELGATKYSSTTLIEICVSMTTALGAASWNRMRGKGPSSNLRVRSSQCVVAMAPGASTPRFSSIAFVGH